MIQFVALQEQMVQALYLFWTSTSGKNFGRHMYNKYQIQRGEANRIYKLGHSVIEL